MDKQKKYIKWVNKESDINLSDRKLIIKQSTVENGGNGVFAGEFIAKDTIFCKYNAKDVNEGSIARYINDLLYQGNANEYEQNELTNNTTNIGYVRLTEDVFSAFFGKTVRCYCIALTDIMEGQELSRYYGSNYWFEYEYNKKYESIIKMGQIPSDYMFIDNYVMETSCSPCINVFAKCVDGKYYYVYSNVYSHEKYNVTCNHYYRINDFCSLPIFKNSVEVADFCKNDLDEENENRRCLIDCSKSDFSIYLEDEPIIIDNTTEYYSAKFLALKKKSL
jgi:hypothetical protein